MQKLNLPLKEQAKDDEQDFKLLKNKEIQKEEENYDKYDADYSFSARFERNKIRGYFHTII